MQQQQQQQQQQPTEWVSSIPEKRERGKKDVTLYHNSHNNNNYDNYDKNWSRSHFALHNATKKFMKTSFL